MRPVAAANSRTARLALAIIVGISLAFALTPTSGDRAVLVTGYRRLLFSGLCIAMCAVLYRSNVRVPGYAGGALRFLGETSYAIYLFHPIVMIAITSVAVRFGLRGLPVILGLCIPATLLLSHLSYQYLERPAMQLGSRLATDRKASVAPSPKTTVDVDSATTVVKPVADG